MDRFFYARIQSHELQLYLDSPESARREGVTYLGLAGDAAAETGGAAE